MSKSFEDLSKHSSEVPNVRVKGYLELLWLSSSGNRSAKDARLLSLAQGPTRKNRLNLLQLVVLAVDAVFGSDGFESFDPVEMDWPGLDEQVPGAVFFERFVELVHGAVPRFLKFPGRSMFADLDYDDSREDGAFSFEDYRWPTQQSLLALTGSAPSAEPAAEPELVAELSSQIRLLRDQMDNMQPRLMEGLRQDISENRFGAAGDQSMATLRRTLAFRMDPAEFFLYGAHLARDGSRKVLCDSATPLSRELLDRFMFECPLTSISKESASPVCTPVFSSTGTGTQYY
eukprot:SAG11_NODE_7_length_31267_cov_19.541966_21_plen_288_part_00